MLLGNKKVNKRLIKKLGLDEQIFLDKQNEIKKEYQRKRDESCIRGTNIHAMFENSFYGKKQFDFGKFGFKDLVGEFTCNENYYTLDLEKGVYPEFLISVASKDGLLRKRNSTYKVSKSKTNKSIDKTSYYNKAKKSNVMMKYPLDDLQDCNFNHYQLQLSLYAYMLQQINPNYNIKGLKIVHTDHNNKQHEYDCEYLKKDVERMLKHYKK